MRQAAALAIILLTLSCTPRLVPAAATAAPSNEAVTLGSLQRVDEYPLYTMHFAGPHAAGRGGVRVPGLVAAQPSLANDCRQAWGCSLFAALGDEHDRLLGRNFDWKFSPALLLFTDPAGGYASVSMVDIAYLGFDGERSRDLERLSLEERKPLLDAPSLPFDGMNEAGIAVGMAAVPAQPMPHDPHKATLDELQVMREVLDHAASLDEAIAILGDHNVDMGSVPIHYMIASASGQSAVVEFYRGEMRVFRNESTWQAATNFLIASTNGQPGGNCWRYDRISTRLDNTDGRLSGPDAMALLGDVSQDNTQWSVVYHLLSREMEVVMGRGYSKAAHTFQLDSARP